MLRYLFTAEFTDGSKLVQTHEDKSQDTEGKNVYYDVLNSGKTLKTFTIREQKIWNPTEVKVDLIAGVISVNGVPLYHEPLPSPLAAYELVWYMQVTQLMKMEHEKATGTFLSSTPHPEIRIYFLGWKTTIDGVEYKQVIGVK